ncbi:MAG TPA: RagB/SusD family nutrient uptake outer membrane protein [Hanamia sp.]|nr:RagB/SusD family nutrient uptake outer membrane protein [Hanamia sp.]
MKKYRIIIFAFIAIVCFASCKKFLTTTDTNPVQTNSSYYKTPSDAFTALVGCYNGLDLVWNNGGANAFPVCSEVFSDNCFGGTGASDGFGFQMMDEFDPKVSPSDASIFSGMWKAYYQAIYRCNVLLQNLDQVNWGDSTALRKQYSAETRFIRAYLYFDMVRLWEKVPLITKPTLANVPQNDPEETYTQIMSDLRFASDSLPSVEYSATQVGRVTKWAAESLLARVYLFYSGYYGSASIGNETAATALAATEDVIAHSGHALVSDYNSLWPAAAIGKNVPYAGLVNKEVVFSIKYSSTGGNYNGNVTGNTWMVMEGIREQTVYPYQYGWGACTVDPKLWSAFSPTDTRRFASVISVPDENLAFSNASKNREYTGYYLKKYSPLSDINGNSIVPNFQTGQYQDYFSIRYSDVLLMAAELGSPNAVTYFNQVHQRANPNDTPATSITKANILAERRLEFAGEGIRYWDLLRQGIATAASTIAANTTVSFFKDNTATPPTAAQLEANIKQTRGFQQIPNDQITLSSGTLIQNPGW